MITKTEYSRVPAYITKDGATVRELMHPQAQGNRNQSLAEAVVAPGCETLRHRHQATEEIYHFLEGEGMMTLGAEECEVRKGDTVLIPSGAPHRLRNTGTGPLRLLCCCAPAYAHEDTAIG